MSTTTDYRGLSVLSPDAVGAGGILLMNDLKELANRVGPFHTAAADPGVNDDGNNTGGNGKFYQNSHWYNTTTKIMWVCISNSTGAANWQAAVRLPLSTDALQINYTGNARGANAVDLQTVRASNTQVASGVRSVVGGGYSNTASATYAVVGGGTANIAYNAGATVGGGGSNKSSSSYSTVGGGKLNQVEPGLANTSQYATIGGGYNNQISSGTYSTIGGGNINVITGTNNVIAGGTENTNSNPLTGTVLMDAPSCASIGGGHGNVAQGIYVTVSGGYNNYAIGAQSTVGGGSINKTIVVAPMTAATANSACHITTSGHDLPLGFVYPIYYVSIVAPSDTRWLTSFTSTWGPQLTAATPLMAQPTSSTEFNLLDYSSSPISTAGFSAFDGVGSWVFSSAGGFIGGGSQNTISGYYNVICGGVSNTIRGRFGFIGSGQNNSNRASGAVIVGGSGNTTVSAYTFIGGGETNVVAANADHAVIVGGVGNTVIGSHSFIGGGVSNTVSQSHSSICGGENNHVTNMNAVVCGGSLNTASGVYSSVGGGSANTASGPYCSVSGGYANTAGPDACGTVGGGANNVVSGEFATISGGYKNTTTAKSATIAGGASNTASGTYSAIAGGFMNTTSGQFSTIVGGYGAATTNWCQVASASGYFVQRGDAQGTIQYVLRNFISHGTNSWYSLYLDGSGLKIVIPENTVMTFDILIAGSNAGQSMAFGYQIIGTAKRAGTAKILGQMLTVIEESTTGNATGTNASFDAQVVATGTSLDVQVRDADASGAQVKWVATIRTAEVSFPT